MGTLLGYIPVRPVFDPGDSSAQLLRTVSSLYAIPLVFSFFDLEGFSVTTSTFNLTHTSPTATILSSGANDFLFLSVTGSLTPGSGMGNDLRFYLFTDVGGRSSGLFLNAIYQIGSSSLTVPVMEKFFDSFPGYDSNGNLIVKFKAVIPRISEEDAVYSLTLKANPEFATPSGWVYTWSSFSYAVEVGYF